MRTSSAVVFQTCNNGSVSYSQLLHGGNGVSLKNFECYKNADQQNLCPTNFSVSSLYLQVILCLKPRQFLFFLVYVETVESMIATCV